jgi:hypothetical protein
MQRRNREGTINLERCPSEPSESRLSMAFWSRRDEKAMKSYFVGFCRRVLVILRDTRPPLCPVSAGILVRQRLKVRRKRLRNFLFETNHQALATVKKCSIFTDELGIDFTGIKRPHGAGYRIDNVSDAGRENVGEVSAVDHAGQWELHRRKTFLSDQDNVVGAMKIAVLSAREFSRARSGLLEDNFAVGIIDQDFGAARL